MAPSTAPAATATPNDRRPKRDMEPMRDIPAKLSTAAVDPTHKIIKLCASPTTGCGYRWCSCFIDLWLTSCACVAAICEPVIKHESWSATLHLFGLVDRREAVGCVQVNKHHWCSGFTVFLLTVRGFSSKTPWRGLRRKDSPIRAVGLVLGVAVQITRIRVLRSHGSEAVAWLPFSY